MQVRWCGAERLGICSALFLTIYAHFLCIHDGIVSLFLGFATKIFYNRSIFQMLLDNRGSLCGAAVHRMGGAL